MFPRDLFGFLLAPLAILFAGSASGLQEVVLFVADDVGYQDLADLRAAGRRPNVERLASAGFEFTRAYANPVCSPSRRSIYFGDWRTRQSGDVDAGLVSLTPGPELVSLAERVAWPSGFFGKWHVGSAEPTWELAPQSHGFGLWRAGLRHGNEDYHDWLRIEDGASFRSSVYEPAAVHGRWLQWQAATRPPRLSVYAPQLAHAPFHRPPPGWIPGDYPPTTTNRELFESMIVALDTALGLVLQRATPGTVVVFVGDNGTPSEVAPQPNRAKKTTFERGIRVPLILAGKGIPHGSSAELVHVVDLYATVAELAGARSDSALASRSLIPVLTGGAGPHARVLCGIRGDPAITDDVCVRSARFKLRRTGNAQEPPGVREFFYDLLLDPGETTNVIDDPAYAAEVQAYRAWLDVELVGS